jgi:hypothetical protein
MKCQKQKGDQILTTIFQYKKNPAPTFYDLTFEKDQTNYNQISSNLCIFSKTKRPFEQLEPSIEKNSKEKKQCSNKNNYLDSSYG